jgi:hypothetical protein
MLCGDTHIKHDKLRLVKHLCIDTLEDKVVFPGEVHGHKVGAVDVAMSIFPDIDDLA